MAITKATPEDMKPIAAKRDTDLEDIANDLKADQMTVLKYSLEPADQTLKGASIKHNWIRSGLRYRGFTERQNSPDAISIRSVKVDGKPAYLLVGRVKALEALQSEK